MWETVRLTQQGRKLLILQNARSAQNGVKGVLSLLRWKQSHIFPAKSQRKNLCEPVNFSMKRNSEKKLADNGLSQIWIVDPPPQGGPLASGKNPPVTGANRQENFFIPQRKPQCPFFSHFGGFFFLNKSALEEFSFLLGSPRFPPPRKRGPIK